MQQKPASPTNPHLNPHVKSRAEVSCFSLLLAVFAFFITVPSSAQTAVYGRTDQHASGNRLARGKGDITRLQPVDISLGDSPIWLVGAPFENGVLWIVALEDGGIRSIRSSATSAEIVDLGLTSLPPGSPPYLEVIADQAELLRSSSAFASRYSPPIRIAHRGVAFIDTRGNINFETADSTFQLPVKALPDARLVSNEQGLLALLTHPTTRYPHNVLGDNIEAGAITVVGLAPQPNITKVIEPESPWVIEGIAPIWTDLNGDRKQELVVTLSNQNDGGKLALYAPDGTLLAEGPGIGRGFRWRNQMAVAAFGPDGERELCAVKTPHIGGTVEFYRWIGDRLELVASQRGFTSHQIRSRNLDLAITGRFVGTSQPVVILPNDALTELGVLRRTTTGVEIVSSLPIGGRLATNLAAATLPDGTLSLAVARVDGTLRIWKPTEDIVTLNLPTPTDSSTPNLTIYSTPNSRHTLEQTTDLQSWTTIAEFQIDGDSNKHLVSLPPPVGKQIFFRTRQVPDKPVFADVTAVTTRSSGDGFNFTVEISSPDTGCEQYANWWEVTDQNGKILYRRNLLHSHVNEQPFRRSGGPVQVDESQKLWIRAHLHPTGYGGKVFTGTLGDGFTQANYPQALGKDPGDAPAPDCQF